MIRNLIVITVVGLFLAIVGISGALALGGRDLTRTDWIWVIDGNDSGDDFRMERGAVEPDVTRTLEWAGGERLGIDVPARVIYIQGATAGVVVTGPAGSADRVRIVDGRLTMDDADDRSQRGYVQWNGAGFRAWSTTEALTVTVTAPAVTTFDVSGSGDLDIRDYDQPTLAVNLTGSSDVEARGRAAAVTVSIDGSGDVDLSEVQITDATVRISGSGDATVGPSGKATLEISGSGDVDLTRTPAELEQTVSGSGDVSHG